MRYIFFGTPEFAAIVLQHLIDAGHPPLALVCNPDRGVGRKNIITPPPTKQLVEIENKDTDKKIEILQPEKLDASFTSHISSLKPDFFVVAAYAKIIPQAILSIPLQGAIGVHPSLLPRLRGASPIQSAILEGEARTGVTLYLMDDKMDHGPILAQETLASYSPASARTPDLLRDLAHQGGTLLAALMPKFADQKIQPEIQDESAVTLTRKFKTEDGFVPHELLEKAEAGDIKSAEHIDRLIRALNPEPGVWTLRNDKRVKLLEAELQGNKLKLGKIQIEGKKPQTV